MFNDKKLFLTGGTGSIGSSICSYFNKNGCKEIYSTTTNIDKVRSDQDFIKFKELNLNNIETCNLDDLFDFDIDFLVLNAGLNKDNIFLRMSPNEWNSVINVNLNSSFYLLKHFVKKRTTLFLSNSFIFFFSFCKSRFKSAVSVSEKFIYY